LLRDNTRPKEGVEKLPFPFYLMSILCPRQVKKAF